MLAVAEPPDAAADEGEEDKANSEGTEDFILPEVERPPQLGEFIAEALDLELEVGVAGGVVVKVAVVSPFVAVVELQSAALSLVAGRIRVRRIIRKGRSRPSSGVSRVQASPAKRSQVFFFCARA